MTFHSLQLENGLPIISKNCPVVQIQELPVHARSPAEERNVELTHGIAEVVGKFDAQARKETGALTKGLSLKRPSSGIGHVETRPTRPTRPCAPRRSSSADTLVKTHMDTLCTSQDDLGLSEGLQRTKTVEYTRTIGSAPNSRLIGRRRAFRSQTTHDNDDFSVARTLGPLPRPGWSLPISERQPHNLASGVVAPPTPPEEDFDFKWHVPNSNSVANGNRQASASDQALPGGRAHESSLSSSSSRPSEILLPNMSDLGGDDSTARTWLTRACRHLGEFPSRDEISIR
jgi:hypothetical protein